MKQLIYIAVMILFITGNSFSQNENSFSLPLKFDHERDAARDISETIKLAKESGKRILLDVGGEWCIWCHRLDAFIESNKELKELIDKNFIWLKINYSKENKNEKVLSKYPEVAGYPHFFVLDTDGKFLHSQNTGELEEGKDYSKDKLIRFFKEWSQKK